jgi:hypothetical protein
MSVMTHRSDAPPPPPRRRAPRSKSERVRPIVLTGLLALVIAAIAVAVSWTHAPWRDYVHRKPASYVELTVVNPQALPSTFVAGQVVSWSFAIHNVEPSGTHRTVGWVTSVRDTVTGKTAVVNQASAVIEGGSVKTVRDDLTIAGTHRSEVIVKLGTGQQVDFYVTPRTG